jgi:hypothetical protein
MGIARDYSVRGETQPCGQSRARSHGIAGIAGILGIAEAVTC